MAEVNSYSREKEFVIEIKLDETDPRVCDYCNKLLVNYDEEKRKLICVEDCFSTEYGLMCESCKGTIETLKAYKKDEEYFDYFEEYLKQRKNSHLVQRFLSKRSGNLYEVAIGKQGLSCDCKGWIFRRSCKHVNYVLDNLTIRNGQGNIVAFASVLTDIPTYQEALAMAFGRDKEETAKWLSGHIKVIEL